jgi:hypothetical protein
MASENRWVLCFEGGGHGFSSITRNMSGRGGREVITPPSLETRVRGVEVGGKLLHLMFRAREGWWWQSFPSVTQNGSGRGGRLGWLLQFSSLSQG